MKNKNYFIFQLVSTLIILLIFITGCSNGKVIARSEGPGDIYKAAGFPPVTAHSTTRALYAAYNGPLYQLTRESDRQTLDIGVVQATASDAGGHADAAAQDKFCENDICWISTIY